MMNLDEMVKNDGMFTCLAVVKPNSKLAHDWGFGKLTCGVLEYEKAFADVIIRWGDGSWLRLTDDSEYDDIVLIPQCDEDFVNSLFR